MKSTIKAATKLQSYINMGYGQLEVRQLKVSCESYYYKK